MSSSLLTQKLRKALAQLPYLYRALFLVWTVAKPWTIAWTLLLILQGLLPAVAVYLTKVVVDGLVEVTKADQFGPKSRLVLLQVLLLGALMVLIEVIRTVINWVRTVQAEILQDHINTLIHQKSIQVDLAFYENPDYYDHLHRARTEASHRPAALLDNFGALLQNGITLVAMGAILIPLGPILTVALLLSTLPAFVVVVRYALMEYQWRQSSTPDQRRSWYYDWLLIASESAAELRLFGLGDYFQSKYAALRTTLRKQRFRLARRQSVAELLASTFAMLIVGAAMLWMVWRSMHGLATLGQLALVFSAFNLGQRLMRTLLENVGQLYGNSLFLSNLFEFLALRPSVVDVDSKLARMPRSISKEIHFDRISFQYPDALHKALDDFELRLPAGKVVAIVGPNGAGKSTLIKLLCRLYDPTEGEIRIDDIDLKLIPLAHLRSLITVLFQQPFQYNNTVQENVQFGDIDRQAGNQETGEALHAAGATEIVNKLPKGQETLLGKWFTGGTGLSVGEWQRIALARAFLRRAQVIILDEPTSALDPWAESDWLTRFRKLANGRTSLIITHRFTTAMHADIIHVMHEGRIVESGSHGELLEKDGLYAESWAQQTKTADKSLSR